MPRFADINLDDELDDGPEIPVDDTDADTVWEEMANLPMVSPETKRIVASLQRRKGA